MTAKFARFDILETLSLQEYARRLRLARKHREQFDDLEQSKYLIDENEVYVIDSHPVIERHGSAAHTPDAEAADPIDEARDASVEEHEPREAGSDARGRGKMNEQMKVSELALILFGLGGLWLGMFMADTIPLGLPRWLYLVGAVAFVVAADIAYSQQGVSTMRKVEMFADLFIVSLLFVGLIVAIIWLLLRVVG